MKKIIAVTVAIALLLMSAAALGEGNVLMPVELNVDSLEYVDETHYLIARDADSRLYGLYNTDGEMLIPCEYGLLAYAEYGFFEAINEDGLNTHALLPGQRYCAPPPGSRQAACAGRIYTARDGDTLAMIAERFGTTMRALLERNPNLTPNDFTNGQAFCV